MSTDKIPGKRYKGPLRQAVKPWIKKQQRKAEELANLIPQALYCDGGVIGPNPSAIGGTWCYCWVVDDEVVQYESGIVTAQQVGQRITNNYTELYAAYMALTSVPKEWSGTLYTDSIITLYRTTRSNSFSGIPAAFKAAVVARRQGSRHQVQLLKGHPTTVDVAKGHTWDGVPVSKHNVFCDEECQRLSAVHKTHLKALHNEVK